MERKTSINDLGTIKNMTVDERNKVYNDLLGYDYTEPINYSKVDTSSWEKENKREIAREQIVKYITDKIMKEYNIDKPEEALLKWEDYKEKHNITIDNN
jgi:hypothetical protein